MATQEELRLEEIRRKGNADPDPRFMQGGAGTLNSPASPPTPVDSAPALDNMEDATALAQAVQDGKVPESKRAAAMEALENFRLTNKAAQDQRVAKDIEQQNVVRTQAAQQAMALVATDVVSAPRPNRTPGDPRFGGAGGVALPPNHPNVLANQAAAKGFDTTTGYRYSQRFGQGLAVLKEPQLKYNMLDRYNKNALKDAGIAWPENMPTIYIDEDTGELVGARPITQQDIDNGQPPENLGKVRMTMINPVGMDLGDIVEFAPELPSAVASMALAMGIGAATKSPQLAATGSAGASAMLEGMASPMKNKLLRDHYGVTQEEIDKYSDPNEALKAAMFAGGADLAMAEGMIMRRWMKNRQAGRTLTEADYDALILDLDGMKQNLREFAEVTGQNVDADLMLVQAAAKNLDTTSGQALAVKVQNLQKRLGDKVKRIRGTADDVARLQTKRGFDTVTNRAITDDVDPTLLGTNNGVYSPVGDAAERGTAARQILELDAGVTSSRQAVRDTTDNTQRVLDDLAELHNSAEFVDVQKLSTNRVAMAVENEELQWEVFKDMLEPNTRGTAGIVIDNSGNTQVKRAMANLNTEGMRNYSKTLGEGTQKFVADMEALAGGTLDIAQVQRLRSSLVAAKRAAGSPGDTLGWKPAEISQMIDAIDNTVMDAPWVRTTTGKPVPAQKVQALKQLENARESTRFLTKVAQKSTIRNLTDTIEVFDAGAKSFGRREFTALPSSVRDSMFKAGDASVLRDVLHLSGGNPTLKAGLAAELEGIYKQMVLNADGSFKQGAFQQFKAQYGDHMNQLFGPDEAARITHADTMVRAVDKANLVAKKVEDLFLENFGHTFQGEGVQGVVLNVMGNSNVSAAQARNVLNSLDRIAPDMATGVRAEMGQWMAGQMYKTPLSIKGAGALDSVLRSNESKIRAVMGDRYVKDLEKVQNVLSILDTSDVARGSSESVQSAFLQVTRSIMGPLSRKQRFMTAFNRIQRNRGSAKALELMSDPDSLRKYVKLGELNPQGLAFWSTVDGLGLNIFMEEVGLTRPDDLKTQAESLQRMQAIGQGGIF